MQLKSTALLVTALFFALLAGGCAMVPTAEAPLSRLHTTARLANHNWDPFNRVQLETFIATYGKDGLHYNPAKPPYAVFDWDNTMVFLDVAEATLIYQLENLHFAMTPEQMDSALRMAVPKGPFVKEHNNARGRPVDIDLIVPDAVESYRWLYDNYKGLNGTLPLDTVKKNPHYTNFITKVRYLYEAIGDTFDVSVAYPWITYLFSGMNEQQVRAMVNETIQWQMTQPIEKVTWVSPEQPPGQAGVVSVSWKNGLRLMPEMQDIFRAFREAGIDVWVCTASFVDLIREISSNPRYGYNNPPERVIGMELERDSHGVIQTEFRRGYLQTQQKGKTRAIERFIVPKYGYGPIFVAGDSEGDMNMMQDFADTRLILIINRLKGKDIATLSRRAVESYGKPGAGILLQGRNDNSGEFVKSQLHTTFGAAKGRLLR